MVLTSYRYKRFLLYIEPSARKKSATPIEDNWVRLIELALSESTPGAAEPPTLFQNSHFETESVFCGIHETACGQTSDNQDYLLQNGMITNSLAPFYLRWYRKAIPASEWRKLEKLKTFYEGKLME